jgi:uncharacterized membrane protein YbhN (UPF0104 family)
VLLGLFLVSVTYLAAALSYVALGTDQNIGLRRTFGIQVVTGITNRLLPAIICAPWNRLSWHTPHVPMWLWAVLLMAAVALCLLGALRGKWIDKARTFVRQTLSDLRSALTPNRHTLLSLLSNMMLTVLNALILCIAVAASGGQMFWPLAIAILSLGAVTGAVIPTPGGLGGTEAGIFAGLVASGVATSPALAAALLFRLLTYWLPIVPGIFMLPWVKRQFLT